MPFDTPNARLRLADAAEAGLRVRFDNDNHKPSEAQWAAISDLLEHLEMAAEGGLDPAVYLSAIPAGTGKTATLAQFANALMADPSCSHVGMLIAVNRVTEVEEMAKLLVDGVANLCVIAGQPTDAVRSLGHQADADDAQVVICTQEALKRTLKASGTFDAATRFHFHGQRRSVVAWDEAFAFNRPVVLNPSRTLRLMEAMSAQSSAAAGALWEWSQEAKEAAGGMCQVPDFAEMGVEWRALEDAVADDDETLAQAQFVAVIAGKAAYAFEDNRGAMLVTYTPELPPSLLPVIVTDASAAQGVHHASYEQMGRTRPVKRLKEATKTYRNMTVRLIPVAASRSAYRDDKEARAKALIEMGVAYIRQAAPEPVLVVSYRNRFKMKGVKEATIREAINARLEPSERARVQHVTWGRHTATNEHRDVRHVLLMGLNFLPRALAHAASGAALDRSMQTSSATDHPTTDQVDEMRAGMLRDSTLQAILRGNARKAADGDCGQMEAAIFQSPMAGLSDDDYRNMFPGASIVRDPSLLPAKPLRGRLKRLAALVVAQLDAGAVTLFYAALAPAMGMDARELRRLTTKSQWLAWLKASGLVPCKLDGGRNGVRRTLGVQDQCC